MNAKLQAIVTDLRVRLRGLYGTRLRQLIVFGSQARGDAEPESDIDVLVVLGGEVSPCEEIARTEELVSDVSLEHGAAVVCVFVSESL